jgi:hypothetical protein
MIEGAHVRCTRRRMAAIRRQSNGSVFVVVHFHDRSAVSNAASLALCFLQALSAASFAPKYQAEAKARAAQRRCTGLQLRFQRAVTALHRVQLRNDFDEAV